MIWIENIWRLVVLLMVQVLLFSNLHFMGICSPYVYVLFLIALPLELPVVAQLCVAAALGLVMDIVGNTPGVHMAACVALMYAKPHIIHRMIPDDERLIGTLNSTLVDVGTYAKLVVVFVLIHHAILFIFANFTWHFWWLTLLQIVVSSAFTALLLIGWEMVRHR